MSTGAKWQGIFPALTTKFTADDRIDHAEMARCIRLQIEAGVDGLIVCGSLGEASTLDADEKVDILRHVREVADQCPVLLTICDGATRNAQRLAERRRQGRSQRSHGAAGPSVQVGQQTSRSSPPSRKVRKTAPGHEIISVAGDRYQVLAGVDNLALESFAMGAVGWVAGLVAAGRDGRHLAALSGRAHGRGAAANDRCRAPRLPLAGSERERVAKVVEEALQRRPTLPAVRTG